MCRFLRCPVGLFCSTEQACHPCQCLVTPLADQIGMQSMCGCHLAEGLVFAQHLTYHFCFEFRAVTVSHSVFHPLIFTLFYCPIFGVHHTTPTPSMTVEPTPTLPR